MFIWIVAHRPYATALKEAVDQIIGPNSIKAYDLSWEQDPTDFAIQLEDAYSHQVEEEGLVFVDLLGGSPMNSMVSILKMPNVLLISGVNMPMLLSSARWENHEDAKSWLRENPTRGIEDIKNLLRVSSLKNNDNEAVEI